jgi:hypothetical protein
MGKCGAQNVGRRKDFWTLPLERHWLLLWLLSYAWKWGLVEFSWKGMQRMSLQWYSQLNLTIVANDMSLQIFELPYERCLGGR